jgi:hypothetical protein
VVVDFGVLAGFVGDDAPSDLVLEPPLDDAVDGVLDDDELSLLDDDPLSFEVEPAVVAADLDESFDVLESDFEGLSRLSVLKNPDPLNVTPTGVKTFLTGRTSPDSGCANSVRVASVNACWTSIVSPVSTNLYTYVGIGVEKISSHPCRSAVP